MQFLDDKNLQSLWDILNQQRFYQTLSLKQQATLYNSFFVEASWFQQKILRSNPSITLIDINKLYLSQMIAFAKELMPSSSSSSSKQVRFQEPEETEEELEEPSPKKDSTVHPLLPPYDQSTTNDTKSLEARILRLEQDLELRLQRLELEVASLRAFLGDANALRRCFLVEDDDVDAAAVL